MRQLLIIQFGVLCQMGYITGGTVFSHQEEPLKLTLCYEAYCPDCILYDGEQLAKAWDRFNDQLQLFLVPFGNTKQKYVKGHWVFKCQHGPQECLANRLHACAIDQACPAGQGTVQCAADDVTRVLGYTSCVMARPDQLKATHKCAMAQKLDGDSIIECARNERGEKLLNMYGNYTNSLQPEHEYVPWVILDEKHNEKAEKDLIAEICAARPSWCSSHYMRKDPRVDMV